MVSPIHLLLFGSRKVEYVDGIVRLDNWINLDISPKVAAAIVALRPALESLVIRAAKDPETILELSPLEEKVLAVIKSLCGMNACRYEMDPITGGGFQSRRPPRGHSTGFASESAPPPKMMRGGGGFGSGNYRSNGSAFGNRGYGGNRGFNRGGGGGNWGARGFQGGF